MGWQNILTQSDITKLIANTDVTLSLSTSGFRGATIQNITPYYWQVQDSNGTILFYIEPWQQMTYPIEPDTQDMNFVSMVNSRPQVQSNSAPSSTWAMDVQLTTISLPFKQKSMSVSSAANVGLGGNNSVSIVGTTNVNAVSGTLDANITGASVTVDTSNVDAYISNNSLVYFGEISANISNFASGSQIQLADISGANLAGFYDGIILLLNSANGYNDYNLTKNGILFNGIFKNGYLYNGDVTITQTPINYSGSPGLGYAIWTLSEPTIFSDIALWLVNISSNTIVSDTVTIKAYAIMASVTVKNTNSSPVNTQGIPGGNSVSGTASFPASTQTIISGSQNTTVTRMIFTPYNNSGSAFPSSDAYTFVLINGSIAAAINLAGMATGWGNPTTFDFGEGIVTSSSGITIDPNVSGLEGAATIVTKA